MPGGQQFAVVQFIQLKNWAPIYLNEEGLGRQGRLNMALPFQEIIDAESADFCDSIPVVCGNLFHDRKWTDTIRCLSRKVLTGQVRLANGDYKSAKLTFDKAVAQAEEITGDLHPETLRYKSEQARVYLYLGNVTNAGDLALLAVAQQFELSTQRQITDLDMAYLCKLLQTSPRDEPLTRVSKLLDLVLKKGPLSATLHLFLVSTLLLVARIEVCRFRLTTRKGSGADLASAKQIWESLHDLWG
ncbi:hypothetical protein HRG_002812 [Hirsutella rhossiliensis]|uniref:Uncharacterized protein n=1 Tax=Hirsutella rhossiliensis TaxID=111463 RepID=A0A9P8N2L2_9HYPO|nr:uncharacterized protein HRG_02812 [Hirsutella rhossiliensis]KAH0964796.1 hypothetical protein HRG_02812 [Hirsutella rhossiliensis]